MIEEAHQRARDILVEHRGELESLSKILLRRETIEREEFLALLEGQPEEVVFRRKDEEAARRLAEGEEPQGEPGGRRARLPYPAAPGRPVPEG